MCNHLKVTVAEIGINILLVFFLVMTCDRPNQIRRTPFTNHRMTLLYKGIKVKGFSRRLLIH